MIIPLLAILVAAAAALLVVGTGERQRNVREFWSVAAGVLQFLLVASMVPQVMAGSTPEGVLFQLFPGVTIAFRVDGLGLLFALGASLLWIATSFYSIGYVRTLGEHAQTRYFTGFALALSATMGVAFAANLFTLFLFYEALTLATYALVAHKETPEARAGARKYIIHLLGAAKLLLLPAIVLTYHVAGDARLPARRNPAGRPGERAPDAVSRSSSRCSCSASPRTPSCRCTAGCRRRWWRRPRSARSCTRWPSSRPGCSPRCASSCSCLAPTRCDSSVSIRSLRGWPRPRFFWPRSWRSIRTI